MCDKNQVLRILQRVYFDCIPLFGDRLKSAYLYGSYARGDYSPESDIDILLTADLSRDEISKLRRSIANITSSLSIEYDVTVSVTVKPEDQFKQYSEALTYYSNVLKEGIRDAG